MEYAIEHWPLDRLLPYAANARTHSDNQVAQIERALRNSSKSRDVVIDPFAGSGTTLIAAEKTGRAARLVELDPGYCDVIVRRWQDWTDQAASLDGDGKTFDAIAGAERLGADNEVNAP